MPALGTNGISKLFFFSILPENLFHRQRPPSFGVDTLRIYVALLYK
jgi:hypothetical protein